MKQNFTFSVPIESPASFGLRKNRIKAQGLSKSDGLHAIAALAGISPIFANRVSKSVRKLFGILDDSAWRYSIGLHPPGGSHIKTYFARQHSDSPAGLSDTLIVACRAASPRTPQKLNKLPVRPDVVTLWRHLAAPGLGGAPEGRSLMTNDNVLMGNHYHLCIEDNGIPAADCQTTANGKRSECLPGIASGERKEESRDTAALCGFIKS